MTHDESQRARESRKREKARIAELNAIGEGQMAERARKAQKTAEKKARSRARTQMARETRAIEMRTREALGDRLAWLERYEVDGRVIRNPGDLTGWDDVADMTATELYALAAWGGGIAAGLQALSEQHQGRAEEQEARDARDAGSSDGPAPEVGA